MNQYDCAALAILALLIFGLVSIAVVVFMISDSYYKNRYNICNNNT